MVLISSIKKWLLSVPAKLCATGISEDDDELAVQKKSLAINFHLTYVFFLTIYLSYSLVWSAVQRHTVLKALPQAYVLSSFIASVLVLFSYQYLKKLRPLYYTIIMYTIPLPYLSWVCQLGCFASSGIPYIPWSFVATVVTLVLGNQVESWLVLLLHLALPLVPLSIESCGYMSCQVSSGSGYEVVVTALQLAIPASIAFAVVHNLHRQNRFYKETADLKQVIAEKLLLNVLPSAVASELLVRLTSSSPINIYQSHPNVTVGFSDICGFSSMCLNISAEVLVSTLNGIFSLFDILCQQNGVEKIKTIGDAYMFVGFPKGQTNPSFCQTAIKVTDVAVGMLNAVGRFKLQECPVSIRVGLHSGPVVGGVIGCTKFSFDIWGPVVNMASRLQSHGEPNTVHVSMSTANLIRQKYVCIAKGDMHLKGIGFHPVYVVQTNSLSCPVSLSLSENPVVEDLGLPRLRSLAALNEKRRQAIYPSLEHLTPSKSPRCFQSLNLMYDFQSGIGTNTAAVGSGSVVDSPSRSSRVEKISPSLTTGDLVLISHSDSTFSFQESGSHSFASNPLLPQTQNSLTRSGTGGGLIVPLGQNKQRSNSSMFSTSGGGVPLSDTADTVGSHSSSGLNEVVEAV